MKGLGITLCCVIATSAAAQSPAVPERVPIHAVAPSDARTIERLKSVQSLVQFDDGRVLVNDLLGQRLVLFDRDLNKYTTTADTLGSGASAYLNPVGSTALFHYLGDSAAFTDITTSSLIIIGPGGVFGRTMAHPRPQDMRAIISGGAMFDAQGRFVYRAGGGLPTHDDTAKRTLDTLHVVRADFDARRVDTVASIAMPSQSRREVFKDDQGKTVATLLINPVPPAPDEWSVISDGSIAVVRAHDYHIDWLYADGKPATSPKMPFDWRRLTDADKQAKIDSARHIVDSINATGHPYQPFVSFCSAGPRTEDASTRGARCAAEHASGRAKAETVIPTVVFPPLDEIPDYVPPIRPLAVKSDRDNHLWILPSTTLSAVGGGLLYDVVNKQGEIEERVQLPAGRSIAGFGPNGVVYLLAGDRVTGYTIERTRVDRNRAPR